MAAPAAGTLTPPLPRVPHDTHRRGLAFSLGRPSAAAYRLQRLITLDVPTPQLDVRL